MKLIKNKLAVTVIILSVTFLILLGYSANRENGTIMENSIGGSINVVQGFFYNVGNKVKNSMSFIFNFSNVKNENEKLKKQNSELKNKTIKYGDLLEQNKRLRAMLDFKKSKEEFSFVGADVVGKSGGQWSNGLIINKGSSDGIIKGLVAVTNEGMVGKIEAVYKNWAIISTLNNENIVVHGSISGTDNQDGIIKGIKENENLYSIKLTCLPNDSKPQKGNIVVTSNSGNVYPKNIKIGEITEIEEDKVKLMKNATIKPYVDFDKIDEVLIVIPKGGIPESGEVRY